MKKLIAIETARAAVVTQWTKKVIVEKQTTSNSSNVSEPLVYLKNYNCCGIIYDSLTYFFIVNASRENRKAKVSTTS